jgi:hypothetical protein
MRFPIGLTIVAAVATAAVVLLAGTILIDPPQDLITLAELDPTIITPNADNSDDVTLLRYAISEPATVSIVFIAEDGTEYVFRDGQYRDPGERSVLFSGVVDGFTLSDDDAIAGEIMRRLIPNGTYTWRITAAATTSDAVMERSGTLVVAEGDSELPQMMEFSVSPQVFTPNQDGIADRTMINIFVNKPHEVLEVYLQNANDERIPIARREEWRDVGEAGRHVFDYEGGVDIGADPPEDGVYTIIAEVRDAEGQETRQTATLEIRDGGKPRAEIIAQSVGATVVFTTLTWDDRFSSDNEALGDRIAAPDDPASNNMLPVTLAQGDLLVFKLTVENYGPAPIRTSGPPPGTVYEQGQRAASLDAFEQSGVWRVGIDCETAEINYPWRWGLGDASTLETDFDPVTGNEYLYLPSGGRAVVWGAIRMTDYNEFANPMACWAGLIHEDVEISIANNQVGRREIEIAPQN